MYAKYETHLSIYQGLHETISKEQTDFHRRCSIAEHTITILHLTEKVKNKRSHYACLLTIKKN